MGQSFFLVVTDDPNDFSLDFEIDPDLFRTKLVERWPNLRTYDSTFSTDAVLHWDLIDQAGPGIGSGTLFRQFVSFRYYANDDEITDFVLWFRDFLPKSAPLLMSVTYTGKTFQIVPTTNAEEIREMFKIWRGES